jgi:hypothetical protein
MPKFKTLEEAQAWADESEPKLGKSEELSKQVATLNRENGERRLANEKLEKDLLELRDSGKSAARKEAEAAVKAEHEAKIKELTGKGDAELRRLKLERAALAAGVKADKLDYAVRLLPTDVDLEKVGEAVTALVKDFPALGGTAGNGEATPPGGKGGGTSALADKVKGPEATVALDELVKG